MGETFLFGAGEVAVSLSWYWSLAREENSKR